MNKFLILLCLSYFSPDRATGINMDEAEYLMEPERTTPSGSYERIKAKAQSALLWGTAPQEELDFIKVKKRQMYYENKLLGRTNFAMQQLNSNEFRKDTASPKSIWQQIREKEEFRKNNPDYRLSHEEYYDHLMNRTDIFLDNYDIINYRKLLRNENLKITVDWNKYRRFTNTTIPTEDSMSNELHRIHNELFRTQDPVQQLGQLLKRKQEQYWEQQRRANQSGKSVHGKVVQVRYMRRPKGNVTPAHRYGKVDIMDSDEYVKELINRRPRIDLKSDAESPIPTIDESAIRAQYSNEVDALKKIKSLEAKRMDALLRQVAKLKGKLRSTTTEQSVWMNHPMILNRLFSQDKIIVDKCIGENYTLMPTTVNFYHMHNMMRNTRTTDVSLLSREILRGQDTLQASQFEKYLAFMRKHRNNSALEDILDEEMKARGQGRFIMHHNGVSYLVNSSQEVIDHMRQHDENQARELTSDERHNMSAEFNVWRDWTSKIPESTTEDPVLYREPPSYGSDSHPEHNTSDEVNLMWKKYKMEVSPDYTFYETTVIPRSSTPSTSTIFVAPADVYRAKMRDIDRLERRVTHRTTPEYDAQHDRVLEYVDEKGQVVRVHEIGYSRETVHADFDPMNLIWSYTEDEQADNSKVVKLDPDHGESYMDLDTEEAIAGTLRKSSLTTLKWRPITRTTPTTVSTLSTKPAWFIKSSQRFFQKLEDRKRWELEKLNRTKPAVNQTTKLPIGFLHEDDLYYDPEAMPLFDAQKARDQLYGTTASYQVGSFENLPYVEKKNRMRASIKRQRALNEYYSRKFSMTTLFPPTRHNWDFLKISSARYYWGNLGHTWSIHQMNSSEAYEDDKQAFYAKIGLNKKKKTEPTSTVASTTVAKSGAKKTKTPKTKKTKPPTPSVATRPRTSFPIPINGSYEEWKNWNDNLKEENNIIDWYSDTQERIQVHKMNRTWYTKKPIEYPGVYYKSGPDDYPVNCSLSLETDVPEAATQWQQFTRLDLTVESIEEPPYERLPFDLRTTLDSRAHQVTLYPRLTTPSLYEDSSEEWDKLNLAIPAKTKPPKTTPGATKGGQRKRRSLQSVDSLLGEWTAGILREVSRKRRSIGSQNMGQGNPQDKVGIGIQNNIRFEGNPKDRAGDEETSRNEYLKALCKSIYRNRRHIQRVERLLNRWNDKVGLEISQRKKRSIGCQRLEIEHKPALSPVVQMDNVLQSVRLRKRNDGEASVQNNRKVNYNPDFNPDQVKRKEMNQLLQAFERVSLDGKCVRALRRSYSGGTVRHRFDTTVAPVGDRNHIERSQDVGKVTDGYDSTVKDEEKDCNRGIDGHDSSVKDDVNDDGKTGFNTVDKEKDKVTGDKSETKMDPDQHMVIDKQDSDKGMDEHDSTVDQGNKDSDNNRDYKIDRNTVADKRGADKVLGETMEDQSKQRKNKDQDKTDRVINSNTQETDDQTEESKSTNFDTSPDPTTENAIQNEPPQLDVDRLINHLEQLKDKYPLNDANNMKMPTKDDRTESTLDETVENSGRVKGEEEMVDNLKLLFRFLEKEHGKNISKSTDSQDGINNVHETSNVQTEQKGFVKDRNRGFSSARAKKSVPFRNNLMDMPAMKELKQYLRSHKSAKDNSDKSAKDNSDREIVDELLNRDMKPDDVVHHLQKLLKDVEKIDTKTTDAKFDKLDGNPDEVIADIKTDAKANRVDGNLDDNHMTDIKTDAKANNVEHGNQFSDSARDKYLYDYEPANRSPVGFVDLSGQKQNRSNVSNQIAYNSRRALVKSDPTDQTESQPNVSNKNEYNSRRSPVKSDLTAQRQNQPNVSNKTASDPSRTTPKNISSNPDEIEEIHYDSNSKQILGNSNSTDHPMGDLNEDYVNTQTESKPEITMVSILCTVYEYVLDVIIGLFKCIDAVVRAIRALKDDISSFKISSLKEEITSECKLLKNKLNGFVDKVRVALQIEENVINLIKYMKLQHNETMWLNLHRLKRHAYLALLESGELNIDEEVGMKSRKRRTVEESGEEILQEKTGKEEVPLTKEPQPSESNPQMGEKIYLQNGSGNSLQQISGRISEQSPENTQDPNIGPSELTKTDIQDPNNGLLTLTKSENGGNVTKDMDQSKEPVTQSKKRRKRNLESFKHSQPKKNLKHEPQEIFRRSLVNLLNILPNRGRRSIQEAIQPKQPFQNQARLKPHGQSNIIARLFKRHVAGRQYVRAKRDVVYTYSDESTLHPDDYWYIDLAAREFVKGRDMRDPNYNRSKIEGNLKKSGIFSFGNFSKECLKNYSFPTVKPPTTWSRNFSIRYVPCTFWNWTRYLEVHYSYMEFLFGTGTPKTTPKKKRNLTAKRLRAHQEYLNRFSPKSTLTTLQWPSTVLKIKGITVKCEDSTLDSELRRISDIVWSYTTTTLAGRQYSKKKKKKSRRPDHARNETEESEVEGSDDVYFEDKLTTTEHIPDWEYAEKMFRHWARIKD
ncbi:hypothetical protein M8J76_007397 [Diaphorina citri]|nr:hypothetical protein M8J76_007397 [Diaphorina citri]